MFVEFINFVDWFYAQISLINNVPAVVLIFVITSIVISRLNRVREHELRSLRQFAYMVMMKEQEQEANMKQASVSHGSNSYASPDPDQTGVAVVVGSGPSDFANLPEDEKAHLRKLIKKEWGWEMDLMSGHNVTAKQLRDAGVGYQ